MNAGAGFRSGIKAVLFHTVIFPLAILEVRCMRAEGISLRMKLSPLSFPQGEQFNIADLSTIHATYKFPPAPPLPSCNGPVAVKEEEGQVS